MGLSGGLAANGGIPASGGGGGGSSTLAGDTDVSLSSPANNQGLVYNGSAWVNAALVNSFQGRTGVVTLSKADVTGTGLAAADVGAPVVGSTVPSLNTSTGSAGSSAAAARADHQHPQPQWTPADHGLLAWPYDPTFAAATISLTTAGVVYVIKVHVPVAISVTNAAAYVVAGTSLTAGQCFAGVYQSGTLIGSTADQASAWASNGFKTMALTGGPFSVAAGDAQIAFVFNGTTGPKLACATATAAVLSNANLSAANSRWASANTGVTTALPGTLTTLTATGTSWWASLS